MYIIYTYIYKNIHIRIYIYIHIHVIHRPQNTLIMCLSARRNMYLHTDLSPCRSRRSRMHLCRGHARKCNALAVQMFDHQP